MTEPSVEASRPTITTVQASRRGSTSPQVGQTAGPGAVCGAAWGPPLHVVPPTIKTAAMTVRMNRNRILLMESSSRDTISKCSADFNGWLS